MRAWCHRVWRAVTSTVRCGDAAKRDNLTPHKESRSLSARGMLRHCSTRHLQVTRKRRACEKLALFLWCTAQACILQGC